MILPLKPVVTKKVEAVQDNGKQEVDNNQIAIHDFAVSIDEKQVDVEKDKEHHFHDPLPDGCLNQDSFLPLSVLKAFQRQ